MKAPGYSGRPLAEKLGHKPGALLDVLFAPGPIDGLPAPNGSGGPVDVLVAFFDTRADLERELAGLAARIFPAGGLWIAWPKRTSGVRTDIGEQTIRDVALPMGLVDNKVCAIDQTWSGLRLVWRKERRSQSSE